jgi:hypothetical protein
MTMNNDERTGRFLKIEYESKPEMILDYPVHCFTSQFPQYRQYTGIWDCGSSGTRISQKVVQDLQLKAFGTVPVREFEANEKIREVYFLSIALSPDIVFADFRVTNGYFPADFDVIIGLDLITQGDFRLRKENGKTVVEFLVR